MTEGINLPGGARSRKKEEELRRRHWEQGYMHGATAAAARLGLEAPTAPPAPHADTANEEIDQRDVDAVAELLFDGCVRIDTPHSISRVVPPRDPPTCDAVVLPLLGRFTVRECLETGLISASGRFSREVHSKMMEARGERRDLKVLHPWDARSKPSYAPIVRHPD
jgi:hypothetical protein